MVVGNRQGKGSAAVPAPAGALDPAQDGARAHGVMVPDLNSGMRVFRSRSTRSSAICCRWDFRSRPADRGLALQRPAVHYIPINYERRIGKSNIKPVTDFLGFTMLIVRWRPTSSRCGSSCRQPSCWRCWGVARGDSRCHRREPVRRAAGDPDAHRLPGVRARVIADVIVRRFQIVPVAPRSPTRRACPHRRERAIPEPAAQQSCATS
jgi:hypothetical protein